MGRDHGFPHVDPSFPPETLLPSSDSEPEQFGSRSDLDVRMFERPTDHSTPVSFFSSAVGVQAGYSLHPVQIRVQNCQRRSRVIKALCHLYSHDEQGAGK